MSLRAIGEVVEVAVPRPWSMDGRSGVTQRIKVQTGRAEIVELFVAEGVNVPHDGDSVDLVVTPRLSEGEGRRSTMKLTVVGYFEHATGKRSAAAA